MLPHLPVPSDKGYTIHGNGSIHILAVSEKWTIYSSPTVTMHSVTKYWGPAWTSGFHAAYTNVAG